MQAPVGYVTSSRMEVYRGSTLALTVASIGVAAGPEVNSHVTAFIRRRERHRIHAGRQPTTLVVHQTMAGRAMKV